MERYLSSFEKIISYVLLLLAGVFIIVEIFELLWETWAALSKRLNSSLGLKFVPRSGRNIMVLFFNILLMMEIMQTIKVYAETYAIKLRIILLVCLIAVSRKVFLLDMEQNPALEFSTAALIFAIAAGYFLVNRSESKTKTDQDHEN